MASLVTSENRACINGREFGFQGIEVSDEIKSEFLMSLMEELQDQVEEGDEERLNSVIQSLEAEINASTADIDHDSNMDCDDHQWISDGEDGQSSDFSQAEGQNWSVSLDELDVNGWIDMEQVMPCSPSNDMNNLYMYPCGDEMSFNDVIGSDYADHTCNEIALDLSHGYSSLWQETLYDSMMYD